MKTPEELLKLMKSAKTEEEKQKLLDEAIALADEAIKEREKERERMNCLIAELAKFDSATLGDAVKAYISDYSAPKEAKKAFDMIAEIELIRLEAGV